MRLLVYDRTCAGKRGNLSPVWAAGAKLYKQLGRIDDAQGVASWDEALAWITSHEEPIDEIQYWGHGKWGGALVDDEMLDGEVTRPTHRLHIPLAAVRERLGPDALVWFRCCEVLGARPGQELAMRLADFLGARIAGHTYVIGFHQSGLHGLRPGQRPDWSPVEGLVAGTATQPQKARSSLPWSPRTITCLHGSVPDAWFA